MGRKSKIDVNVPGFREIVKNATTYKDIFTALGYKESGNIYRVLKQGFQRHNVDFSHLLGQGWSKGKTRVTDSRVDKNNLMKEWPFENVFCVNSTYRGKNQYLLKRLVREGVKEYKCKICGRDEWNNRSLTLHLDHINGDNTDNRVENLRILCPNCHSQTDTYSKNKAAVS
jgi:5-methylcytosine-specific restriction endonuclease McrA